MQMSTAPPTPAPNRFKSLLPLQVNVLHLPGVLNLKVMSILSTQVWNNWDHMAIFSKIPIRAIVSGPEFMLPNFGLCEIAARHAGKWKQYSMVWSFGLLWLLVLPPGLRASDQVTRSAERSESR